MEALAGGRWQGHLAFRFSLSSFSTLLQHLPKVAAKHSASQILNKHQQASTSSCMGLLASWCCFSFRWPYEYLVAWCSLHAVGEARVFQIRPTEAVAGSFVPGKDMGFPWAPWAQKGTQEARRLHRSQSLFSSLACKRESKVYRRLAVNNKNQATQDTGHNSNRSHYARGSSGRISCSVLKACCQFSM